MFNLAAVGFNILVFQIVWTQGENTLSGQIKVSAKIKLRKWKDSVRRAVTFAMEKKEEAAVVVEEENHENVDLNQAHELSVEMKPQMELGHGKLRSGPLLVSPFVEELWFIRSGL